MSGKNRAGQGTRGWRWQIAAMSISLSCSACAGLPANDAVISSPAPAEMAPEQHTTTPAQMQRPTAGSPASTGRVRLGRPTGAGASPIQQVAHQEALPACPPEAISAYPHDPRMPVAGANPFAIGMPACDVVCQPSPYKYPDEYLCDGGDREWPVHYEADQRMGLDTEDTVAEFRDHLGKDALTKSNRVCVYAPRFAAVRSVSVPHEEGTFRELARLDSAGTGTEVTARMVSQLGNRNLAAGGMQMRSRASGLESERLAGNVEQRLLPRAHDKVINIYQDLNFFQSGTLEQSDIARLNHGINAALAWNRDQTPIIQGKVESPVTGLFDIQATALTVIEVNDEPGELRIVKVADKATAEVGEIVTFSIRYDNPGPNPVHAVRIIDNLTPRLEYVQDSATSEAAGRLVVQDNGEGSLVLIWELSEPVPSKSGGVVTFQARVR